MPLILHNVPDEELYVGADGIQRPYGLYFPKQQDTFQHPSSANTGNTASSNPLGGGARARRGFGAAAAETGAFGKSSRRSRSRTGTPKRDRDRATITAGDKAIGDWMATLNSTANQTSSSSSSAAVGGEFDDLLPSTEGNLMTRRSQSHLYDDYHHHHHHLHHTGNGPAATTLSTHATQKTKPTVPSQEPVEMILRGYKNSSHQYAAIERFEQLAGRICEDYPRLPPAEQRRYRSDLLDPALTDRQPLTPEERSLVNRVAGGEHWVKITFESREAADAALFASPQKILGFLVHAELWRGVGPARDEASPDVSDMLFSHFQKEQTNAAQVDGTSKAGRLSPSGASITSSTNTFDSASTWNEGGAVRRQQQHRDPTTSNSSSATVSGYSSPFLVTDSQSPFSDNLYPSLPSERDGLRSRTQDSGKATQSSSDKPTESPSSSSENSQFCRRIPTARRAKILPAEEALLPQQSLLQRILLALPLLHWLGGLGMIVNEMPRKEVRRTRRGTRLAVKRGGSGRQYEDALVEGEETDGEGDVDAGADEDEDGGELDWARASLYWKFMWWIDCIFGLFGGEIAGNRRHARE